MIQEIAKTNQLLTDMIYAAAEFVTTPSTLIALVVVDYGLASMCIR